jgi:hypothetical protein
MNSTSPTIIDERSQSEGSSRQSIFLPPLGEEVARRAAMCTVGVDLSASSSRTACTTIEWNAGEALVAEPLTAIGRSDLNAYLARGDWIAIGAPFGWPVPMVAAMNAYSNEEPWPELDKEAFRRRRSDLHLQRTLLAETGVKYSPMSPASSAAR